LPKSSPLWRSTPCSQRKEGDLLLSFLICSSRAKQLVSSFFDWSRASRARLASLQNHQMFLPLLSGLLLRVALAPWTEQRWDSYINRLMGAYVFGYGIDPLFPERSCNCPPVLNYSYPPIWLLLIIPLFALWLGVTRFTFPQHPQALWAAWTSGGNLFEAYRSFIPTNLPLLDSLLKTPVIMADISIGYLIWIMGGRTRKAARVSLLAWILNPYVIMVGAWWGEFDSLALLFMLLSVHYLQRRRIMLSGFWLGMGISTKLFPGVLLIPVVYYILMTQKSQISKYIASLFATLGVVFSSLLFFPYSLDFVIRLLTGRVSPDTGGSNLFSGLSWLILFQQLPSLPRIPFLAIIFPIILALLIFKFRGSMQKADIILPFLTAAFLGIYLSYPTINVQYPMWAIPMLAVLLVRRSISKWSIVTFSVLPLSFLIITWNPLYLLSPFLIVDIYNYPPASDVIQQLWSFPWQLYWALPILFTITVIFTISRCVNILNPSPVDH